MHTDLTGRRVLVTGASSGIGEAVSRTIVAAGGSVAMMARRTKRLAELQSELGERATAVTADVTDLDHLAERVAQASDGLGGLDGLVAVAGKSMAGGLTTGTPERWRELFELNLLGSLATARYAVDHFGAEGRRDLVLVGSAAGLTPLPGVGIYGASKRGLQAAFEALRLEVAPLRINASLVMPGFFETEGLTLDGIVIDGDVPPNDFPMLAPGPSGPTRRCWPGSSPS